MWSDAELRAAFERFDANKSGRLDYRELREALRAVGGLELDGQEAVDILQQYDSDGNGLLDLDEFSSLVRRLAGLQARPGRAVRASSTLSTPPRRASFEERSVPVVPTQRVPPAATSQGVGGGVIWGGAGPPPPGKVKPPQQTFFPPATRATGGYDAWRDQLGSLH